MENAVPSLRYVRLRNEGGIIPQRVHYVMLAAPPTIRVPEGFPDQGFRFTMAFNP